MASGPKAFAFESAGIAGISRESRVQTDVSRRKMASDRRHSVKGCHNGFESLICKHLGESYEGIHGTCSFKKNTTTLIIYIVPLLLLLIPFDPFVIVYTNMKSENSWPNLPGRVERDRQRVKNAARKRQQRLLRAGGDGITPEQWRAQLEKQKHSCIYCGCSGGTLTQDHVIPLARKGKHAASNIVGACQQCNASKKASLLLEWVMRLGRAPQRTACFSI